MAPALTEYNIRLGLHAHLWASIAPTWPQLGISHEFVMRGHKVRADVVAMHPGYMQGFEIKGPKDTLGRLKKQVQHYQRIFDRCTVVCTEKHVAAVSKMVPGFWGIWVVHANTLLLKEGGTPWPLIDINRPATPNPMQDDYFRAQMIGRYGLYDMCLNLGISVAGLNKAELIHRMLKAVSKEQSSPAIRNALWYGLRYRDYTPMSRKVNTEYRTIIAELQLQQHGNR